MSILLIREMWYICPIVCPNFTLYSIYALWREFIVNGIAAISSFLYVDSFLKGESKILKFPVGYH